MLNGDRTMKHNRIVSRDKWLTARKQHWSIGGLSIALVFASFFLPFPRFALGLGVGLLGLAVATGIHDTWWVRRKAQPAASKPMLVPKAA